MRRWLLLPALALGGALALVGTAACRSEGATTGCPSAEPAAPPVDEALMAFLSAARSLHHEANLREGGGDTAGAIASLERLVALPAPQGAVEVDEVLADAHARLAELRLERNDLGGADQDVQAGLARVKGPTYFRGHLLEVQGLLEEARAAQLADAGKAQEAAGARSKAVGLLEEAVHVQEQVIQQALADGGAR